MISTGEVNNGINLVSLHSFEFSRRLLLIHQFQNDLAEGMTNNENNRMMRAWVTLLPLSQKR